jgi:hypothetical protein
MWWAEADLLAHIGDICESEENRAELEEQEVEGTKEQYNINSRTKHKLVNIERNEMEKKEQVKDIS